MVLVTWCYQTRDNIDHVDLLTRDISVIDNRWVDESSTENVKVNYNFLYGNNDNGSNS